MSARTTLYTTRAEGSPRYVATAIIFTLGIVLFGYLASRPPQREEPRALVFQSGLAVPQVPVKPPSWIFSGEGGTRISGPVTILFPPGFTGQSGANVYADMMLKPSGLPRSESALSGTEFALGIWPANDQTEFDKPIEIRMVINAAQITEGQEEQLALMMFHPQRDAWMQTESTFDPSTYEVVATIQSFTPIAKEFDATVTEEYTNWGGRTFFTVIVRGDATPEPPPPAPASSTEQAIANRSANLRSGPGTNFPIVGQTDQGEDLEIVGQSASGEWYQLTGDRWIAAFLVDNEPDSPIVIPAATASASPFPTATITSTATVTPSEAITVASEPIQLLLHEAGTIALPAGQFADLDEGLTDDIEAADLLVFAEEPTLHQIVLLNGAEIASAGESWTRASACVAMELSTTPLSVETLTEYAYFCMRTNTGRITQFRLQVEGDADSTVYQILFMAWEQAPGSQPVE